MRLSLLVFILSVMSVSSLNYASANDIRLIPHSRTMPQSSSSYRLIEYYDATSRPSIGRRQSGESSLQNPRWAWPSGAGTSSSFTGYYNRFVRRPFVDWVVPEVNSTLLHRLQSFLTGLPSYATIYTGIKKYPYSSFNTHYYYGNGSANHELLSGPYSSHSYTQHGHSKGTNVSSEIRPPLYNRSADNSVVSASFLMTTTTRRPLIPILNAETLNGDHLDSDESFLKPVDGMESYNGQPNNHKPPPEYDPMLPGLHRPQIQGHRPLPGSIKKNGLYEAGPIKTTKTTDSTTLPTTLRPRTAKPAKDALSSSLTFGKLPAITLGNIRHPIQPFLQEDISSVPVTGGKPAIITNPYINIDLSPEIKLLGIKIQKQFGLQLGIKIVKPQRFFHRPFSFLTPLIGGAVLSKPPPADLVPVLPHDSDGHVVDYHHAAGALPSVHSSTQGAPPFLFAPLRPTHDSHEAPYSHSDIIIGRKSRTPVMEEETQSKVRMRTPKL